MFINEFLRGSTGVCVDVLVKNDLYVYMIDYDEKDVLYYHCSCLTDSSMEVLDYQFWSDDGRSHILRTDIEAIEMPKTQEDIRRISNQIAKERKEKHHIKRINEECKEDPEELFDRLQKKCVEFDKEHDKVDCHVEFNFDELFDGMKTGDSLKTDDFIFEEEGKFEGRRQFTREFDSISELNRFLMSHPEYYAYCLSTYTNKEDKIVYVAIFNIL